MAALEKYTDSAVLYRLRHNTREHPHVPKNMEIDPERTYLNEYLSPEEHGRTAHECKAYYDQRLKEVYRYGRADLKTACQWVVTAPSDLPQELQEEFFRESYAYLNSLYGERNCIQCTVHYDEGVKDAEGNIICGRPHMHYMFIPVIENRKYLVPNKAGNITKTARYPEKVCADQLINKRHLQTFHPGFQKWLDEKGISCTVHSGVTGGNNRTVAQLKLKTKEAELEKAKGQVYTLETENSLLKAQAQSHDKEYAPEQGWGSQGTWGQEATWTHDRIW